MIEVKYLVSYVTCEDYEEPNFEIPKYIVDTFEEAERFSNLIGSKIRRLKEYHKELDDRCYYEREIWKRFHKRVNFVKSLKYPIIQEVRYIKSKEEKG